MLRPRQSYRHEAFLWGTAEEFLAGMVPFIRDGLRAGEPVMVAVISERIELLKMALGGEADRVKFVDMAELGRNPARIIPGWQEFLDAHSADTHPLRGIGELIWAGRRPVEILECQLHEALLNLAVDPDTPFWLMCPYNTQDLDPSVLEEAHRSHPAIIEADQYSGSTLYGGREHVDAVFGSNLQEHSERPEQMDFNAEDVQKILAFVAVRAHTAGVESGKAADLAVAVHQVAASSLHRGALDGVVRIWHNGEAVICEVHDHARVDDPMAGRRSAPGIERDGLLLANQLCDLVQLRSAEAGTTVRLHHWIQAGTV
jgi:hypothetical protein